MLSVDKLLGVAGMGSTIANISLLKRFLSSVAIVIALTAICSTMAGMLLIAGFYAIYVGLMHHGLDPTVAALTMSGIALLIIVVLAIMAFFRWRELREMPRLLYMETPFIHRAGRLAESFIQGLMSEREERH